MVVRKELRAEEGRLREAQRVAEEARAREASGLPPLVGRRRKAPPQENKEIKQPRQGLLTQ